MSEQQNQNLSAGSRSSPLSHVSSTANGSTSRQQQQKQQSPVKPSAVLLLPGVPASPAYANADDPPSQPPTPARAARRRAPLAAAEAAGERRSSPSQPASLQTQAPLPHHSENSLASSVFGVATNRQPSIPPSGVPTSKMPQYQTRDGDPSHMKKSKQSMADLKLRRLTELNNRLREDLERERIPVSQAAKR